MKARIPMKGLIFVVCLLFVGNSFSAQLPPPNNLRPSWAFTIPGSGNWAVLTWDAVPGADSYKIYRLVSTNWIPVGATTERAFREQPPTHPPLIYAVSAVNGEGEGPFARVGLLFAGQSTVTISPTDPSSDPSLHGSTFVTLGFAVSSS